MIQISVRRSAANSREKRSSWLAAQKKRQRASYFPSVVYVQRVHLHVVCTHDIRSKRKERVHILQEESFCSLGTRKFFFWCLHFHRGWTKKTGHRRYIGCFAWQSSPPEIIGRHRSQSSVSPWPSLAVFFFRKNSRTFATGRRARGWWPEVFISHFLLAQPLQNAFSDEGSSWKRTDWLCQGRTASVRPLVWWCWMTTDRGGGIPRKYGNGTVSLVFGQVLGRFLAVGGVVKGWMSRFALVNRGEVRMHQEYLLHYIFWTLGNHYNMFKIR